MIFQFYFLHFKTAHFQDDQGQISQISQIPLPLHIDNRTNVPLSADSRMILSLEQQNLNGLRGDAQENQLIKVKCTQCRKVNYHHMFLSARIIMLPINVE